MKKLTKLTPIFDNCPKTGKTVDMRVCCADCPCQFYAAKPWSECGTVSCAHPKAKAATRQTQEARRQAFRQMAGVGHILFAGPVRG